MESEENKIKKKLVFINMFTIYFKNKVNVLDKY